MPEERLSAESICSWLDETAAGRPFAGRVARWVAELEKERKRLQIDFETVLEIAGQINAKSLDVEKVESYTTSMMMGQFGILHVHFLRQPDFDSQRIVMVRPNRRAPDFSFSLDDPLGKRLAGLEGPVLLGTHELVEQFPSVARLVRHGIEVLLPLIKEGNGHGRQLKGCLLLGRKLSGEKFSPWDLRFLGLMGNMIAVSLHNAHLYHRSIVDGLTNVFSRGHFDVQLFQHIARARALEPTGDERRRQDTPTFSVSLLFLDVDHFKRINDVYGHLTGDEVLVRIAGFLSSSVRGSDMVARYGGEEFAVILPDTGKHNALKLAERLRQGIALLAGTAPGGESIGVTASVGVSTFPDDASDRRELVARADEALYEAKGRGRNQVVGAGEGLANAECGMRNAECSPCRTQPAPPGSGSCQTDGCEEAV